MKTTYDETKHDHLTSLALTGKCLYRCKRLQDYIAVLTDEAVSLSHSDIGVFYRFHSQSSYLKVAYAKTAYAIPNSFPTTCDTFAFLEDWPASIVISNPTDVFFADILLSSQMKSGFLLPVYLHDSNQDENEICHEQSENRKNREQESNVRWIGILILNSKKSSTYSKATFSILESFGLLARGCIQENWEEICGSSI